MARPSEFNQGIAAQICEEIGEGKSLRAICEPDEMPSCTTIYNWLNKFPEFVEQYARAKEVQAEHYASEIIDIADELPTHEVPDPDGGMSTRVDGAGVQRNRLRVDARKWIASKLLPKKYGDKVALTGGGEGDAPVVFTLKKIGS